MGTNEGGEVGRGEAFGCWGVGLVFVFGGVRGVSGLTT